jgi:hypothetical protein
MIHCLSRFGAAGLVLILASAAAQPQEQIRWRKTVAPGGAFSLHYPDTWAVKHDRSGVSLRNAAADEQILVIRKPKDATRSATIYANETAALFQRAQSSFRIFNLTPSGENVGFAVTYSASGKDYIGLGVIVMQPRSAFWVSYVSPSAANVQRGGALLAAIADTVVDNAGGVMPRLPSVPAASTGMAAAAPPPPAAASAPGMVSLVGKWSTGSYYGDLVNSSGQFVQSAASGQWFDFNADGTYLYRMYSTGKFINGLIVASGRYEVQGSQLLLHQKMTSWTPLPQSARTYPAHKDKPDVKEESLTLKVIRAGEINLQKSGATMSDTFRRQPGT